MQMDAVFVRCNACHLKAFYQGISVLYVTWFKRRNGIVGTFSCLSCSEMDVNGISKCYYFSKID